MPGGPWQNQIALSQDQHCTSEAEKSNIAKSKHQQQQRIPHDEPSGLFGVLILQWKFLEPVAHCVLKLLVPLHVAATCRHTTFSFGNILTPTFNECWETQGGFGKKSCTAVATRWPPSLLTNT